VVPVPPPDNTLERLAKEELERLLWRDVAICVEMARSVRMWKGEVQRRIVKRRVGRGRL
jgi:hypothetical protein